MKLNKFDIKALKEHGLSKDEIQLIKNRLWSAAYREFKECLVEHGIKVDLIK